MKDGDKFDMKKAPLHLPERRLTYSILAVRLLNDAPVAIVAEARRAVTLLQPATNADR